MPATPETFANNVVTTIAGGAGGAGSALVATDTTLILPSGIGADLPSTGPCRLLLGNLTLGAYEIVTYASRSGDTLSGLVRGLEGTTALTWAFGTAVQQVATAGSFSTLWSHVKNLAYNVRDFGAAGDGSSDDTVAISAALSAASTGARLYWPAGNYVMQPQAFNSHVYHHGDGMGVTIITLKAGSNGDLFSADAANINLSSSYQAGSSTAVYDFGFADMTLDGNYANQTSGPSYPLEFYGFGYELRNLEVRNGYSGGIRCDGNVPTTAWSSGGNSTAAEGTNNHRIESSWVNVRSHTNLGTLTAIGIEMGGPHDSRWTNVLSYINNGHSIHCGPNDGGLQAVGCHAWQSGMGDAHSCTWLVECSIYASGCEAEGSPYAQLVILSQGVSWVGGAVYAGAAAGLGIQIGQTAGGTPYTNCTKQSGGVNTLVAASSYLIETLIENITHASGAIWFADDAGGMITARILAASGANVVYSGTVAAKTALWLNTQGYTNPPQQMFVLGGSSGQGSIQAWGQATVSDPGTGGTIATNAASVIPLNPAGAETGLILQAGQFSGQVVTLINRSANSLTFATGGTSHVADGASDVIAGSTARQYVWDSLQALWYRLA